MKQLSPYIIERTVDVPIPYRPAAARFAPEPETTGIGLAECWKVVRTHGRLIGGLMAVTLVLTAVVVFSMTPRYVATARLLIEPEPPSVLPRGAAMRRPPVHSLASEV